MSASKDELYSIVNAHRAEADELVRGLLAVAEDPKHKPHERVFAALQLARTGSERAVEECVGRYDVRVDLIFYNDATSRLEEYPYRHAMRFMGWRVVPGMLKRLDHKLDAKQHEHIAHVLTRVCGAGYARALLDEVVRAGTPAAKANAKGVLKFLP